MAQASKLKNSHNLAFDQLLWEADHERLPRGLSKAMTRPAYKSTSLEQKTIYTMCDRCGYYKMSETGKMRCQFPWFDPQEYDRVLYDYLPCKEDKDEKDGQDII